MGDHRGKRSSGGSSGMKRAGSGELHQRAVTNNQAHSNANKKGYGQKEKQLNIQRQGSCDSVRRLVQEEGREARNLLNWNVPVVSENVNGRKNVDGGVCPQSPGRKNAKYPAEGIALPSTPPRKKSGDRCDSGSRSSSQQRQRKVDMRARYWAFLFENLKRAVDEIYQTCEADESAVQCKEVIMILEQSTKDFKALIERLGVLKAYDDAEAGQKPTSLAWEVRKLSPGKHMMMFPSREPLMPSSLVSRSLNFGVKTGSLSWAERVRGIRPTTLVEQINGEIHPISQDDKVSNECKQKVAAEVKSEHMATVFEGVAIEECSSTNTAANNFEEQHSTPSDEVNADSKGSNKTTIHPKLGRLEEGKSDEKLCKDRVTSANSDDGKNVTLDGRDVEGWETVSRGRVKARSHGNVLTKSNKQTLEENKRHSEGARKGVQKKSNDATFKPVRNGIDKSQPAKVDSDKENIPVDKKDKLHGKFNSNTNDTNMTRDGKTSVTENCAVVCKEQSVVGDCDFSKNNTACVENDKNEVTHLESTVNKTTCLESVIKETTSTESATKENQSLTESSTNAKLSQPSENFHTIENGSPAVTANCQCSIEDLKMGSVSADKFNSSLEYDELSTVLAAVVDEEEDLTKLEMEHDAALLSALQEEETYLKEIAKEQSTELDIKSDEDTDEINSSSENFNRPVDWDDLVKQKQNEERCHSSMSWGDMVEDADLSRIPGRVVLVHEMLSSPSRKLSPTESKRRTEEKHARAQEQRERLLQEKAEHLRTLTKKVEEVRAVKEELLRQQRNIIEQKLERAEQKRHHLLQTRVQKAHEERLKGSEIAFINNIEIQNKRLDIVAKQQGAEARLQDLQEERQRKYEEKQAKGVAAEERRKVLEAERLAKLQEMQERRKQRETEANLRQQEKEKERLEAARARDKEREEKLAALHTQQQAHIEELQKKIQHKQIETDRRHKEFLGQIREKAVEMTIRQHSSGEDILPGPIPYERKKFCNICSVLIPSEVFLMSHLRGKQHQEAIRAHCGPNHSPTSEEIEAFNLRHVEEAAADLPDPHQTKNSERQKALKRRCKKLRMRMAERGTEYELSIANRQLNAESENKIRLRKLLNDVQKQLQGLEQGSVNSGSKPAIVDRSLGEIARILEKRVACDHAVFHAYGGYSILSRVIQLTAQSPNTSSASTLSLARSAALACDALKFACKSFWEGCHYMLYSNKISCLIDLIMIQLQQLSQHVQDGDSSAGKGQNTQMLIRTSQTSSALSALSSILLSLAALAPPPPTLAANSKSNSQPDALSSRLQDIVSYVVCVGLVDELSRYFSHVNGPIESINEHVMDLIINGVSLLTSLVRLLASRSSRSVFEQDRPNDVTQLLATFLTTRLTGLISMMYGLLLQGGSSCRSETPPLPLSNPSLTLILMSFSLLNHLATVDLQLVQECLGAEGTSLEFRHISSYILWYCSHHSVDELLHQVIICIGYFTVLHSDNQMIIQSGQSPTILQQLCVLPFAYFSDPRLTAVLLPTFIACCFEHSSNRLILEQELSCTLLSNFIEERLLDNQSKSNAVTVPVGNKINKIEKDTDSCYQLSLRFPVELWSKAKEYFLN